MTSSSPNYLVRTALASAIIAAIGFSGTSYAANFDVTVANDDGNGTTQNTLSWAILQANTVSTEADTITLKTNVSINGVMKTLLNSDITLQSDSTTRTIDGNNQHRPLFVKSGNVIIKNLALVNGQAKGGDSTHGGAGAGLGGALFIHSGNVTVQDVAFNNNTAIGGSIDESGTTTGAGGMLGAGHSSGGGGGLFASATGSTGGYGGNNNYRSVSLSFGAGGDYGGATATGNAGSFAGGGGSGGKGADSEIGLSYANDGGSGGDGGFGGGGGSGGGGGGDFIYGNPGSGGYGGAGGFGGGGGGGGYGGDSGGPDGSGGGGGHGGGQGSAGNFFPNTGFGGGGAGFGGAIFARQGTTTLINTTFSGNSVVAGSGAASSPESTDGTAAGQDLFICDNQSTECGAVVQVCGSPPSPSSAGGTLVTFTTCLPTNYGVTVASDDGTGETPGTLSWAILKANTITTNTDTITLKTDVTITDVMKTLINSDITLQSDATPRTISGGNAYRPLFVKSGNLVIRQLTIANGKAKGVNANGGGGGAGLGGALFVYDGTVLVDNVNFNNNNASGGNSGVSGTNAGGGMFGNVVSGGFGDGGSIGSFGGNNGHGGHGGNGGFGGGGGKGGTGITNFTNEIYGFGGDGGNGGFGGGGGSGGASDAGFDGSGGIHGYGGGFGGSSGNGGGGAGFGGAIFAMKGTTTLNNVSFSSNSVTAGTGENNGTANAKDVFICTNSLHSTAANCSAVVNVCNTETTEVVGTLTPGTDCPVNPAAIVPILKMLLLDD